MRTKARKSCTVNLGRWFSYAAAGAATGFAASNDAEAAILYSGIMDTPLVVNEHSGFGNNGSIQLKTLVGNSQQGSRAFAVLGRFSHTAGVYHGVRDADISVNAGAVAAFRGSGRVSYYASKIALGTRVSGISFARSKAIIAASRSGLPFSTGRKGQFNAPGTDFLAFGFEVPGHAAQYGWARIVVSGLPLTGSITLVDYAYGTPGQAMEAGAYALNGGSEFELVPEPASLGLLALGAAGLLVVRKGRKRSRTA